MALHSAEVPGSVHVAHNFELADAAARMAFTYAATDVGKVVRQIDDCSFCLVKSTAPTFSEVGGGGGGGGGTAEIFFAAGKQDKDSGDHAVTEIKSGKDSNFEFHIPYDFASLVEIALKFIPDANSDGPGQDVDLTSDYAAVGQNKSTHSETDTTSTYDLGTVGNVEELDLSGVFNSLSPGDSCGVNVANNTAGNIDAIGLRLRYSK